jgi:hypothetical protein
MRLSTRVLVSRRRTAARSTAAERSRAEKPDALTAVSVKRIDRDGRDTYVTSR